MFYFICAHDVAHILAHSGPKCKYHCYTINTLLREASTLLAPGTFLPAQSPTLRWDPLPNCPILLFTLHLFQCRNAEAFTWANRWPLQCILRGVKISCFPSQHCVIGLGSTAVFNRSHPLHAVTYQPLSASAFDNHFSKIWLYNPISQVKGTWIATSCINFA